MKIVFIGGHHNSAIAVAQELQSRGHEIYWFGHKHASLGDRSISAEYLEIQKQGWPFYEIITGKFYRTCNFWQYLKIIYGFFQSLLLLISIHPRLIIGFGGYLSVPVIIAGYILGIPSVIHEQTTRAGMANIILSRLVKKVFLTWDSSKPYFPKQKIVVIGLPIRKTLFQNNYKAIFKSDKPTLFFLGGKLGSHIINQAVEDKLVELIKRYNIIHQTGNLTRTGDYQRLKALKEKLTKEQQTSYLIKPYFFEEEIASLLRQSDLIISRAGAHTIYELALLAKPAILIPISWSYQNEQMNNALLLTKVGSAIIIHDKKLTGDLLIEKIKWSFDNLADLNKKAKEVQKLTVKDASEKMVHYIEKEW